MRLLRPLFKQKEAKILKGGNQQNIPSMNEFETFLGRNLEKSVNKEVWTEIMTVMNKHVEISI